MRDFSKLGLNVDTQREYDPMNNIYRNFFAFPPKLLDILNWPEEYSDPSYMSEEASEVLLKLKPVLER